jgi:two-component system phosphate regulon sensor histidine kinase PhoR
MLAAICDEARVLSGEKSHDITLDCHEGLWLQGNQEELRSAFSNLVFNAVQYTPPKGRIFVSWTDHEGGARFAVRDTGIGIPEHHIPRLTERFYRVDVGRSREAGGTGLGLAIVKHVIQRHDATLRIESEVDKGSEFSCVFPASLALRRFGAQAAPSAS